MKKSFVLLPLVAILTACGGGSDSSTTTTIPPTAAATLPSVISGELTQYNETSGAATVGSYNVNLSGLTMQRSASAPEFHVGMMLTLQTDGAKKVTQVTYDDLLRAPVSAIDVTNKTITMAGMTVKTEGAQWARGLTLETVAVGDLLEVSGYMIDDQTIQATYIELEMDQPAYNGELQGMISALDETAKIFKLGTITVDYSNAVIESPLYNGEWVEVEGTFDATGEVLTAYKVEHEHLDYDDHASMDIEGIVTASSTNWLMINGNRKVTLTPSTHYKGLAGAAAITTGMYLEIEGVWDNVSKSLVAYEVELDYDDDFGPQFPPTTQPPTTAPAHSYEFELEGTATYDASSKMLSINGFFFQVNGRTELEGVYSFEQLNGLWVSVSGYTSSGTNLAVEVEAEYPEYTIGLEGVVAEDGSLWGYQASDGSLNTWTGRYVEVECVYQGGTSGLEVFGCRLDD